MHVHNEMGMPQLPAGVQMRSHIFSAKVVSNCSQAIQVCMSVNEQFIEAAIFLVRSTSLHSNEGKSLWWKPQLHRDVTNTGQKFTAYTRTVHKDTPTQAAFTRTLCF